MSLEHKKTILRKFPSGLFIVTANDDGKGTGAVISFATQVSIEPSYVALCIREDSSFYNVAKLKKHLAVHLPSKNQKDMVASFFKIKEQDESSINSYPFEWSKLKNPILDDIPMILEVKIVDIIESGDHPVFIAEILNTILREELDMLAMSDTNWQYGG
jgi:flavin reductase (DIM6/NTAB) family NADH-FMN oxidoreductase RutF